MMDNGFANYQLNNNKQQKETSKSRTPAFLNNAEQLLPHENKTVTDKIVPFEYSYGDPNTLFADVFAKYELTATVEPLWGVSYLTSSKDEVIAAIKKTNSDFKMYVGTQAKVSVLGQDIKLYEASYD